MAEKRKPAFTILLRKPGKPNIKLELFDSNLWDAYWAYGGRSKRYRIRVDGKWFDQQKDYVGKMYFTKWEFRDLMFSNIPI